MATYPINAAQSVKNSRSTPFGGFHRPAVEEIEPRILYAADLPVDAIGVVVGAPAHVAEVRLLVPESTEPTRTDANAQTSAKFRVQEIAFVDAGTANYEQVVDDIRAQAVSGRQIEVVVLSSAKSGIAQVSAALVGREDVGALHLITHGADGHISLGGSTLDFDQLLRNAGQIKSWGGALSADAELMIYGCDMSHSADGKNLMDALSRLTGATVSTQLEAQTPSAPVAQSIDAAPRDVVLIDRHLDDSAALIASVNPNATVYAYDSSQESAGSVLQWVTQWAVEHNTQIASLSILSHGAAGGFELGNQWITATNFADTAAQWQALSAWFTSDATLDIFGCNVATQGGDGRTLLERLSAATGTDVFASDDVTGVGGDWILEVSSASPTHIRQHDAPLNFASLRDADASLAWYNANWGYRKPVNIDKAMVSGTSNLSNFAVLVSITDISLRTVANGGHMGQSDAGDLLFTSADGTTKLSHEIESYDALTGTLVAWVNVPTLSHSANTSLYLYYGNAVAADQWNAAGTWQSTDAGVWHLGSNYSDSTGNSSGSTAANVSDVSSAKIGAGEDFNGTSAYITTTDNNALDITTALTVSGWFKSDNLSSFRPIVDKGASQTNFNYYFATVNGQLRFEYYNGALQTFESSSASLSTGTWYYAAATYDDASNTVKIFVNGSQVYSSNLASAALLTNSADLRIGASTSFGEYFDGNLDEVRVRSAVTSSDWLTTEYNNQHAPATYVTLTTEQAVNSAPVNTVPGAQSTNEDATKVFSSANGNQISITDADAGGANNQVTLNVTNGTLTLALTTGLTFTTGDGNTDTTMTFRGTAADINTALNGLSYIPTVDYNGSATLTMAALDSALVTLNIDSNLKGRYTFDNTGDLGNDTSPSGTNDATVSGAVSVSDGTRGNVLSFDGTNDYVQVAGVLGSPTTVTLAAWVNLTAGATGRDLISLGDNVVIRLDTAGGVRGFVYNGSTFSTVSSNINVGGTGWRHIAFVVDSALNTESIYIDGTLVASAALTQAVTYSPYGSGVIRIGSNGFGGSNFLNGLVDDARFYDRVLSTAEIVALASDLALSDSDSVSVTVTAVNDAPVLDNTKSPALAAQTEDPGVPVGPVGTLVSALVDFASPAGQVDNVIDIDGGALLGIAIVASDETNGTWYYSTNSGGNWSALGAVSNAAARLLWADTATRLYFQANSDYNGTLSNAITFRAWDRSSGSAGGTVDLSANKTVLDQFGSAAYSNNNGTGNWSADWVETDSNGGGAGGGRIRITGGELRIQASSVADSIYREVSLSGSASATLTFSYNNTLGSGDTIVVQASSDGGNNYTTLAGGTFSSASNVGVGSYSVDLTAYIAANTRIRFYVTSQSAHGDLFVDNVQISGVPVVGGTYGYSVSTDVASLQVTAANDPPVAVADSATAVEAGGTANGTAGTNPTGNVLSNDTDVDSGDTKMVTGVAAGSAVSASGSVGNAVTGSYGSINIAANGAFTYTVNNSNATVQALASGGSLTDTFTYTMQDAAGLASTTQITVTINGANDAPVITSDGGGATANASVAETTATVTNVTSTDADGGTAVYSIVGGADQTLFSVNPSTGALTFNTAPDYETPTDAGGNNVYDVVVRVSDGNGGTHDQAIAVTVTDVVNTLVVTTSADNNDSGITTGASYTAEWLNTHKGTDNAISLREALYAANNTAGANTITFNISGTGVHTINIASALPIIADALTLDASTDDSYAANGSQPAIVLDGNDVAANGLVLSGTADNSTLRGLVIRDFGVSGIQVQSGADNVTIVGNYIGRLGADGADAGASEGNTVYGIHVQGDNNLTVGGTTASDRNVISGNVQHGIYLVNATNASIRGNYFGLQSDGSTALGNGFTGISASATTNLTIGGAAAGAGNVIASNGAEGIVLNASTNVQLQRNIIGADAGGTLIRGNNWAGIALDFGTTGMIGSTTSGLGNLIAHSVSEDGVYVGSNAGVNVAILGNAIRSNGGLGIDLAGGTENAAGVTANDGSDSDTGANALQNYPVLSSANTIGGNSTITGTLNAQASKTYRIEFFGSPTGDASGHGEGQVYLGYVNVSTDTGGNASFARVLSSISVTAGHAVSATATEDLGGGNFGGTSEFAANVTATNSSPGVTVTAISGNTTEAGGTATFTVVLNTAPTADVTVAVSTGDATEGTVSVSTLTFTSINWNTPQTVTVTGVDDSLDDGDISLNIITGATASADTLYNNLTVADVSVTNTDDDAGPVLDLDANNSSGATGANFSTTHTEGTVGGVLIADVDASLTDDDANLASMTVSITNLLNGTAESLSANTTGTGISALYNNGTGVLTLTGTDSVANYQQVLRTLRYANSSDAPNTTARTITVVANDGAFSSNSATVTIGVTNVNDEQVLAVNAGATVAENSVSTQITNAMLATTDVDNSVTQLTYTLSAIPIHGTLKLNGVTVGVSGAFTQNDIDNNRVTYDQDGSETNADSFTFSVNDGAGIASVGAFSLTITPVNDAPVANIEGYVVTQNNVLSVATPGVATNDLDVDGDPLAILLVSAPTNGTLTLNPDGSFSYTPSVNYVGTDSFTYRAHDGTANSNTAVVSIQVTAAAPTPGGGSEGTVVVDTKPNPVATPDEGSNTKTDSPPPPQKARAPHSGQEPKESTAGAAMAAYFADVKFNIPSLDQTSLGNTQRSGQPRMTNQQSGTLARLYLPNAPSGDTSSESVLSWEQKIRQGLYFYQVNTTSGNADPHLFEGSHQEEQPLAMLSNMSPGLWGGLIAGFGTAWWATRAGVLMSSVLVGTPAWARLDPLPIATRSGDDEENSEGPQVEENEGIGTHRPNTQPSRRGARIHR